MKDTLPRTYTQKVAFILLDLVSDVLVKEQLTQDEGAHGLNIKTLRLCQDFLVGTVDGFVLLPLLQVTTWHRIKWARRHFNYSTFSFSPFYCPKTKTHNLWTTCLNGGLVLILLVSVMNYSPQQLRELKDILKTTAFKTTAHTFCLAQCLTPSTGSKR